VKWIDLTLPTPAENLACDEALLDWCEAGTCEDELLRFWESPAPFVVVGYSNHLDREVHLDHCRADGVPVLRRCSGGGTVVQGHGCLNFSLILRIPPDGPLSNLTGTNNFIMQRHAAALRPLLGNGCHATGTTDLAVGDRKFSGNAQRRKRSFLLFHGTFLLDFDLSLIARLLKFPSRQPDYRQGRSHLDFVMNTGLSRPAVKDALKQGWQTTNLLTLIPFDKIRSLAQNRYSQDEWTFKF
jgi:lipoate-protein ligase A